MKPKKNSEDPLISKLEAFQSIDVESDWKELRSGMEFDKEMAPGNRFMPRIWWAAASIILLLGIGFLSKQYLFAPREMIIARAGDIPKEVLLPDGSSVTLNSMAELAYPEKFRNRKREVQLSGEAFFKIERNLQKPFMVHIEEKAMVEVLGTSFNIRSEQSGEAVSVLVLEGRVAFTDVEEKLSAIILNKDEQATLTHGMIQREETINKNMLSWKTGILYFDQSLIGDVVKQLEIYYNREILLEEDIPDDLQFTSTIDNQDLESILKELSIVLGLTIGFEDEHILISKTP
jgi:transmembrane sensor